MLVVIGCYSGQESTQAKVPRAFGELCLTAEIAIWSKVQVVIMCNKSQRLVPDPPEGQQEA